MWTGWIEGLDLEGFDDEEAIWGILSRATASMKDGEEGEGGEPAKPTPPPGSRGIEEMVKRARKKFVGLSPKEAWGELQQPLTSATLPGLAAGARTSVQLGSANKITKARYLVDIRPSEERLSQGRIPNAYPIELAKLEISLDPRLEISEGRTSLAADYDVRYILVSEDGRASSLAAIRLMEMGLWNVSDVVGGFKAWKAEELPFYL